MVERTTNVTNFARTTLTSEMGATATVAMVADTTGFPDSPAILVLEPESSSRREVVLFDGDYTAESFSMQSSDNRYLEGSAAISGIVHPVGATIICAPLAQHFDEMWTGLEGADGAVTDHEAATDPHAQYLTTAEGDAAYDPAGAAADAVTAHEGETDPHAQYLTEVEGNAAYEAKVDRTGASTGEVPTLQGDGTLAFGSGSSVPDPTTGDDGQVPTVQSGEYVLADPSAADRAVIAGFGLANFVASGTNQMGRPIADVSAGDNVTTRLLPVVMDRAGSIVGVTATLVSARTAGTVTFEIYKNGSATGLTCQIGASTPQYAHGSQSPGTDTFVAGDRLDIRSTASSFTPTTNWAEACVTVQFD